jgi:hypothetical protein
MGSNFMNQLKLLLVGSVGLQSVVALGQEALKSPYFIDGVHCEGLDDEDRDEVISNYFSDDEVAKLGLKSAKAADCESLFSQYGATKFEWVTPEDLEKLVFGLKRSGRFKSVDVQVEKSELQNHVHIKGKFEQFDPKDYYSINHVSQFDRGEKTGSRKTTQTDVSFHYKKRGLANPAAIEVGVRNYNSEAANPLSSDELKAHNEHVILKDDEAAAQAKKNFDFNELYIKVPLKQNGSFPIDFRVGSTNSRLTNDQVRDQNVNFELSSQYQPNDFMPVKTKLSLLYSTYNATGAQSIIVDNAEGKNGKVKNSKNSITFAGLSQDAKTRSLSTKLKAYRSLTQEMHYFYYLDARFGAYDFFGTKNSIGFSGDHVYGAVLPEHRMGLPNRDLFSVYLASEDSFMSLGAQNNLTLKVGLSQLSGGSEYTSYRRTQSFAEVGIKSRIDNVDVGLSFIYGNQRLY